MDSYWGQVKTPCYLSREEDDRKIKGRTRTDVRKYYFVKRTTELCKQLPAEVLATFRCKAHSLKKWAMKVFISKGNLSG
jgi:hypothetical protein